MARATRPSGSLALHGVDANVVVPPPKARGRLWYDFQIPDEFFGGLPTITSKVRWVRDHLPRECRIKIGGASAWYESDILAYIESERESQRIGTAARKRAAGE